MNEKGRQAIMSASGFGEPPRPKVQEKSIHRPGLYVYEQARDRFELNIWESQRLWENQYQGTFTNALNASQGIISSDMSATSASVTFDDLLKVIDMMPAGPTPEQQQWAAENGFVNWSGIKVSLWIYDMLKSRCGHVGLKEPFLLHELAGCPLIRDATLAPDEWITAKAAYEQRDTYIGRYINFPRTQFLQMNSAELLGANWFQG